MRSYTGYFCLLFAALCWGLIGPVARFALEDGLTPIETAFWRSFIGGAFCMAHALIARSAGLQSVRDGIAFAIFGSISLGGFFASYQYAVQTGGAALAAVLLYTAPAWVALFSRYIFKERLTGIKIAAIAVSLAGIACISLSGPGVAGSSSGGGTAFSWVALGFGLLSGLLYSTHYIFSKNYIRRYSSFTLYGYCMLFGALALYPFVPFATKSATDWLVVFFLGLVCSYVAYWSYCEGLRRIAPTRAAVLATLEPVIAALAAWWIWDEAFTLLGWLGSVLILAAVLGLVLTPSSRHKKLADDGGCIP